MLKKMTLIIVIVTTVLLCGCSNNVQPESTTLSTLSSTETTAPQQNPTTEATQPVKNWIPQDPDPIEYEENHVQATLAYFGGLLYVHDNREDTIGTELPDGYFYIGSIAAEDSNSIPKSYLRSCHIPMNTDLYASTNDPDYIYYRQDTDGATTYRRMIRAALVENYWGYEKLNDTLPEDYLKTFFLDLMKGTPYFNLYGTATGTEFAAPEDIDLHTFFYNGFADLKQGVLPLTDEETSYLLANGWGGDKPISNAQRYPVERMDELLRKYLGIGFEDTNKIGLDRMDNYRQQNECYYRWLSDFFGVVPRIVSVEADGDAYKVTYYRSEYDDCQYVMTLEREGHTLMIRSNIKAAYEEYISTVAKGEYRFVDLDGDGERELIINWKNGKSEIVTISDGNVVGILSGWHLFLCEGSIIGRFGEGSGGTTVCYHKIENGEAVVVDVVVRKSHDGSFYRGTDPNAQNMPRISKEEAHKIAEQYALLDDSIPYYLTWLYT